MVDRNYDCGNVSRLDEITEKIIISRPQKRRKERAYAGKKL